MISVNDGPGPLPGLDSLPITPVIPPVVDLNDHMRIVTPDTEPSRFTALELAFYRQGKCGWQLAYGTGGADEYCANPSKPGASFGHCAEHEAELLEEYFPDGSPRW
jgi:hypothetical protein